MSINFGFLCFLSWFNQKTRFARTRPHKKKDEEKLQEEDQDLTETLS